MKHTLILLITLPCSLFPVPYSLSAAMPLTWTVETSRATPAQFEAYQGETLCFEATLQSHGKPLEMSGLAAFFWQTNGMGSAYWQTSAAVNSNRLSAVFTPEMDVGAKVYNCFIGSPSNIYHAAFQLRLRPSPGATPNVLPLPVPVIDFAKVRVLNPPWPTGGTDTNAVIDIIHETVSGSARSLPKYLHTYDADDSYPDAAQEYYRSRGDGKVDGGCSAVRRGGFLYRNFDFPFDDRAEFVVHMSSGSARFASVGVAQVGTNLTEQMVTSGKWSKWYKALPGATVDGINENGVVVEINVVDTPVTGWHTNATDKAIHPLAAPRWVLDHATNAQHGAEYIATNIRFPQGWEQNFHYMVADAEKTYIVENGTATDGDEYHEPDEPVTMTNFQLSKFPWDGMGMERFGLLLGGANITNAWYTRAYLRTTNWVSEFKDAEEMEAAKSAWETYPREQLRGHGLWQSVHTSVYDLTNRTLRIAVQEVNDWYVFQVPVSSGIKVETDPTVPAWAKRNTPPEGMTDNALVWTNNAVKTKNGAITVGAADVGALPSSITHLSGDVPISRTVNGYELSADINLSAADVAAYPVLGWLSMFGDDLIGYELRITKPDTHENVVMSAGSTFAKIEGGTDGYWGEFHLGNDGLWFSDPFSGGVSIIPGAINRIVNGRAYIYSMPLADGILALESWQSLSAMIDNTTNQAARTSVGTKIMTLIDQPVQQKINNAVNANLNTYIDGETGVEYIGKFYGGSLYYVPTGNVYPPNN